jgi:acetyl-CoA carboxylase biotin carboxyl carrier protein
MSDKPDWNDLLDLLARLDDGDYDNVAVQFGDVSVRMSRTGALDELEAAVPRPAAQPSTPPIVEPAPAPTPSPAPTPPAVGTPITSPMIGVFYRRSSPSSPPFVEVGQEVTADTTIGIVEIMKLMNPVKAGMAGVIHEIIAKDGEAVEFGQVLAVLDASSS